MVQETLVKKRPQLVHPPFGLGEKDSVYSFPFTAVAAALLHVGEKLLSYPAGGRFEPIQFNSIQFNSTKYGVSSDGV